MRLAKCSLCSHTAAIGVYEKVACSNAHCHMETVYLLPQEWNRIQTLLRKGKQFEMLERRNGCDVYLRNWLKSARDWWRARR